MKPNLSVRNGMRQIQYRIDIHLFPENQILKSFLITKNTIFRTVKEDILADLLEQDLLDINSSYYYELMICFESCTCEFFRAFTPDEKSSVVSTILQQDANSLGKVRLYLMDMRYFWGMKYYIDEDNDQKIWKPIEAIPNTLQFELPNFPTVPEILQIELSNIAIFQGKLQRKYDLNKKQELWRDVWCMVMKDRLWMIPLANSIEREYTNFNLPISIPLSDDTVITENINNDKSIFSIASMVSQELTDGNKKTLVSVTTRKDIFKAKDSTTARQWIGILSYQNISHRTVQHLLPQTPTNLPNLRSDLETDNDIFQYLEERIAEEQKIHTFQDLQDYQQIYSFRKMLYNKEVRASFYQFLCGRNVDILFKVWQYLEDFRLAYPHAKVNYTTCQQSLSSLIGNTAPNALPSSSFSVSTSSFAAPSTSSSSSKVSSRLVFQKIPKIHGYAISLYELMTNQSEDIQKYFDQSLLKELYTLLLQTKQPSVEEDTTVDTNHTPFLLPLTIFDKITAHVYHTLEQIFYEQYIYLKEFQRIIRTHSYHKHDSNHYLQKLVQDVKARNQTTAATSTATTSATSSVNLSNRSSTITGGPERSTLSQRISTLFTFSGRNTIALSKINNGSQPLPLDERTSNLSGIQTDQQIVLKFTESMILRIREQLQLYFPPQLSDAFASGQKPIGTEIKLLQAMPDSWWYLLKAYDEKNPGVRDGRNPLVVKTSSNDPQIMDETALVATTNTSPRFHYVLPLWYPVELEWLYLLDLSPSISSQQTLRRFYDYPLRHHLELLGLLREHFSTETMIRLQFQAKLKEILTFQERAFPSLMIGESLSGKEMTSSRNDSITDRNNSISNSNGNSSGSKDIAMVNYIVNSHLKDVGTILYQGIMKVDYFPSRCILPENGILQLYQQQQGFHLPGSVSEKLPSLERRDSRRSRSDTTTRSEYSPRPLPMEDRQLSRQGRSTRSIRLLDHAHSNTSVSSIASSTTSSIHSTTSTIHVGMLSTALSTRSIQPGSYPLPLLEDCFWNHFYSNPAFISEDFLQLLFYNYYKNHFHVKLFLKQQQEALSHYHEFLGDASTSGNHSPFTPTVPTPMDRSLFSVPTPSTSPVPPPGSRKATTTNSTAPISPQRNQQYRHHCHFHHPENHYSSNFYTYYTQLKQYVIISQTADGMLHLYCFDLFTNQITLHLRLLEQRLIRPTKMILHSFQILDNDHNIYQFTGCDSFVFTAISNIFTGLSSSGGILNSSGASGGGGMSGSGVGNGGMGSGSGGTVAGSSSSSVSGGGGSSGSTGSTTAFLGSTKVTYTPENNLIDISKRNISQLLYLISVYNEVYYGMKHRKIIQYNEENPSTPIPPTLLPIKAKVILILKQGWLQKKGRFNTSWKNRYVVLTNDGKLRYFKDDTNANNATNGYKGVIDLQLTDFDVINPYNSIVCFEKDIIIHMKRKKGRIWTLRAENAQESREWVNLCNEFLFHYHANSLNQYKTSVGMTGSMLDQTDNDGNSNGMRLRGSLDGIKLRPNSVVSVNVSLNPNHFSDEEDEEYEEDED